MLLAAGAAIVCSFLISTALAAEAPKPNEYQVRAAYIYNFGKFVKWPAASIANQEDAFTICVLGEDSFGGILQATLAGESLGGRPVHVKRIARPQEASSCHVLYLNNAAEGHLKETLAALDRISVLTVSEIPGFSRRGGMIQFVLDGERVRFEINRANAESAGLTLTSDLLKVAVAVWGNGRTGGH
jgi:hypothetical protein